MDLSRLIEDLKNRLPEYLSQNGHALNDKGLCCCPNPAHPDKNPSCGVIPTNPQVFHCFGCGVTGNIFHAAEFLQSLPRNGIDFLRHTLPTLASNFGMDFDFSQVSENDHALKSQRLWNIMADAATAVRQLGSYTWAAERGWSEQTCKDLGIGSLAFQKLAKYLYSVGWQDDDLEEAGIDDTLFFEDGITFTICDKWGRPVGFSTRNMVWEKGDGPKYKNTPGRVPIYTKKGTLYNLHRVKQNRKRTHVVLVEGFPCVVSAWEAGYQNVVALCGAEIAHEQIDLLVKSGITAVTIALDADANGTGTTSTRKALDNIFAGREDIRVKVLDMMEIAASDQQPTTGPARAEGHCDVDELIRIDKNLLGKIKGQDPFEWRLTQFDDDEDPEIVCQISIPLIVNEPNNIRRDHMSQFLSERTGIRKAAIDRELDLILKKDEYEARKKVDSIKEKLARDLSKASPASVQELLASALDDVRSTFSFTSDPDRFSPSETISFLDELREEFNNVGDGLRGFTTGFPELDRVLDGLPKEGALLGIAAKPNVGKSALVSAMCWNIACSTDEATVLHWSIDDSRSAALPRIVAMDAGININIVKHPAHSPRTECITQINRSWERVRFMVSNEYYDIRDSSQGTNLDYLESWLEAVHNKQPEAKKIVILDNFHKLSGSGNGSKERFEQASDRLQKMKNKPSLGRPTFIVTLEVNKVNGKELTLDDISDTRKIMYDADLGAILYSDFDGAGEESENYWLYEDPFTGECDIKQPRVKLTIHKNKISGYKGSIWFKFLAMQNRFIEDVTYVPGLANDESTPEAKTWT